MIASIVNFLKLLIKLIPLMTGLLNAVSGLFDKVRRHIKDRKNKKKAEEQVDEAFEHNDPTKLDDLYK